MMVRRLSEMPPLPVDDDEFNDALVTLAERVNGAIYDGERLQALLGTVRALRDDPDLADQILGQIG
jgi:hypothetical protein